MRISDWSSDVCSADLPNPNDPWESYNRSMYAFNTKVDNAVLKPVAKGYNAVTPEPVRTCIHNMFNNVRDIWSAFNSFIQRNGVDFIHPIGRLLFNTTMTLGGRFAGDAMNVGRSAKLRVGKACVSTCRYW